MKKVYGYLLSATFILISCNQEQDPYVITKDRVGVLTNQIQVNQLDSIYAQDSIVKEVGASEFSRNSNKIKIYDRSGEQLLLLEPVQAFDSTSTIGFIRVMDLRFETENGLNIESTFGDIVENYTISRIVNTLSSVVVFIDGLNLYITIDKEELPSELRYNNEIQIQASQIPDDAKFKYFMIGWN